ncbi:hypothetical protein [Sphingomonas bacterium]|uniref:hypothetical protein n=1 Tax=Sphingomonas bacterium TaxID=1895847 RepID=UPI0015754E79|nr:hypothetical protein [Sphingomonas bacterium]
MSLNAELLETIGEHGLLRLAEAFGGTRLYIPLAIKADHEIVQAIGAELADFLVRRFAPDRIKVPVARELRARVYRAGGATNADIARALGVTREGVQAIFQRLEAAEHGGEIAATIGEDGLIALAAAFGGTRLYVPERISADHDIVRAIGADAAATLAARFALHTIRVPLAREQRAVRLRSQGASNAQIAVKLGMTETGVNKLFARITARGAPS